MGYCKNALYTAAERETWMRFAAAALSGYCSKTTHMDMQGPADAAILAAEAADALMGELAERDKVPQS